MPTLLTTVAAIRREEPPWSPATHNLPLPHSWLATTAERSRPTATTSRSTPAAHTRSQMSDPVAVETAAHPPVRPTRRRPSDVLASLLVGPSRTASTAEVIDDVTA